MIFCVFCLRWIGPKCRNKSYQSTAYYSPMTSYTFCTLLCANYAAYWLQNIINIDGILTHWSWDKMVAILRTIFSYTFYWIKPFALWLKFHKVGKGQINNKLVLVQQIMAWCRQAFFWIIGGLVYWRMYSLVVSSLRWSTFLGHHTFLKFESCILCNAYLCFLYIRFRIYIYINQA